MPISNMGDFEDFVANSVREKYEEARELSEESSKNDPETEPYRSKYKARELIHEMRIRVQDSQKENPDDSRYSFLLAAIDCCLGINYSETEENHTGEKKFKECVEVLENLTQRREATSILHHAYNHLGILWSERGDLTKACDWLEKAYNLYNSIKESDCEPPQQMKEHFGVAGLQGQGDDSSIVDVRRKSYEDLFTHTLYYLAQVQGKLGNSAKSAEFCYRTLSRQINGGSYQPLDWTLNAATLAQFYVINDDYPAAHHCLASASVISKQVKVEELTEDQAEQVPRAIADLDRCWAKYCLALLEASSEKLLRDLQNEDEKESDHVEEVQECKVNFKLDLSEYNHVCQNFIKTYEEAKPLFVEGQRWLQSSKSFYGLDGHCSDYVQIVQDNSKLYKSLAFYEHDFSRQCKMHKRRIDILEDVLKELNPQFYLLVCRQLMYEIAETYSAMVDLKLAIVEEAEKPATRHEREKINSLAAKSIKSYQDYIDSLKKGTPKKLPKTFESDDERPALIAHFCTGRLHSKFVEIDARKRIDCLKKSLEFYSFLVKYCEENPSSYDKVKNEVDICKELVELLPVKMSKIMSTAGF